jgi:hypothetical protein
MPPWIGLLARHFGSPPLTFTHVIAVFSDPQKLAIPLIAALLLPAQALWGSDSSDPGIEFFEKRIRPLLSDKCIECHGPEKQKGGLRLDFRQGWEIGGDSGPALVPGKLDESRIVHAIHYDDADFQMPPKSKLADDAIADLEDWIAMGAPDPRTGEIAYERETGLSVEDGRDFWSFKPIDKPEIPAVADPLWPKSPVDHFVRSAQETKGLIPTKRASRVDLVRRAYFSLIGLPPTPKQIEAFVQDEREDSFELLIDELLASPHYGERWGRHWLDVARFAESSGGGRTLLFKDAWRFRDYVIETFNRDVPFDQFVREQIAGDLLPYDTPEQRSRQLIATAFLALGPTNYELQDKQLLRFDVIDEQTDTLGKAFMGMTLGCVRCHDHKFDPIPSEDYYALAGIFKSTRTLYNYTDNVARWVDTPLPLQGLDGRKITEAEEINGKLKPQLERTRATRSVYSQHTVKPPQPGPPQRSRQFPGIIIDDMAATVQGSWQFSQYSQNYLEEGYLHDGNSDKGSKELTFQTKIPIAGTYEARLAYAEAANRSTRTPVTVSHNKGETTVTVNQKAPPSEYGRFHILGRFDFDAGQVASVLISNANTDGYVVADAVQWYLIEDESVVQSQTRKDELARLEAEIESLEKELKPITRILKTRPIAMTVKEDPFPSDAAIRIRGIQSRRGDIVPRGFLQIATLGEAPEIPSNESGRRQLAEWIVSPGNPLTSRVIANRIWTWLFGQGIVSSVDNFGTTGQPPSHPELLDYLAIRLQELDWSVKSFIREIMLSETWQLSTTPNPVAAEKDPSNRLLTAYPKRRLDAEQLRDAILAASGDIDLALYGPNINGASEIDANTTAAQRTEYNYVFKDKRRSVYTPAFRVKRHELFELFDFGNINFTIGQRNTSTVALQALYMLNNPFIIDQSRIAAQRLIHNCPDPDGRIDQAFATALGRSPSDQERRLIDDFLNNGQMSDSLEEWTSVFQSLFGSIDFRYLN